VENTETVLYYCINYSSSGRQLRNEVIHGGKVLTMVVSTYQFGGNRKCFLRAKEANRSLLAAHGLLWRP
jgi:hypothetical protein